MRLKESFDTSKLPVTFYGTATQSDTDLYDQMTTVIFSAVLKEDLSMFMQKELSGALPDKIKNSVYFKKVWDIFQKESIDSPEFLREKASYLSMTTGGVIGIVTKSFADAKYYMENTRSRWWEITVKPSKSSGSANQGDDYAFIRMYGYAEIEEEFSYEIKPVSSQEEIILSKLYQAYIKEEPPPQDGLGTILQGTQFSSVRVNYVGAGLCCALLEDIQIGGVSASYTTAFFDMGYTTRIPGVLKNTNQHDNEKLSKAQISYLTDLAGINGQPAIDVIISHWHADHVHLLLDFAAEYTRDVLAGKPNPEYGNFWSNTRIYAPDFPNRPGIQTVQGAMGHAGNAANFHLAPCDQNNDLCYSWHAFNTIVIWKCDRNDRGSVPHPHDHGVFATLTLASGNTVFLTGDCRYDIIGNGSDSLNPPLSPVLTNNGAGYDYLQVSHHGGEYTRTGAANCSDYIPIPAAGGPQQAVYSADGISHGGHPTYRALIDHNARGWLTGNEIRLHTRARQMQNCYYLV